MALTLYTETLLKNFIGPAGRSAIEADELPIVEIISNGIVKKIENYTGRKLAYQADYTEIVKPNYDVFYLEKFPVDSISSIIPIGDDGTYDTDDAIATTDYHTELTDGKIIKNSGCWTAEKYQIIYTGGFRTYGSSGSGTDLPDNLIQAHVLQFKYEFDNRQNLGLQNVNGQNGQIAYRNPLTLLPEVKEILDGLSRVKMYAC